MSNNNTGLKRYFHLSEDVSQGSVKSIIDGIYEINKEDNEKEEKEINYKRKPIEIIVNTFGGSVYDGLGVVAAIEISKTPIHTICLGKAMSMGFLIFTAGHKRFIHPLATLMYHEVSAGVWDKLEGIKQEAFEFDRLMRLYDGYVTKRTNIMQDKLDDVKSRKAEWYVSAEDAVKLGIADEILV